MSYRWQYRYGNSLIEVVNETAVQLIVDNEVQDKKEGIRFNVDLNGKLKTGEQIKASLGGTFKIKCNLFVDNVLQTPILEE